MTHIIPVLHNSIVNRIRYIKLMPQICTGFSNNNILHEILQLKTEASQTLLVY